MSKVLRPVRMAQVDCIIYAGRKDDVVCALHKRGLASIDYVSEDALAEKKMVRATPAERVTEVSERIILVKQLIDALNPHCPKKVGFLPDMLGVDTEEKVRVADLSFEKLLSEVDDYASNIDYHVRALSGLMSESDARLRDAEAEIRELSPYESIDLDLSMLGDSELLSTFAGVVPRAQVDTLSAELDEGLAGVYCIEYGKPFSAGIPAVFSTTRELTEPSSKILSKNGFARAKITGYARVSGRIKELENTITRSLDQLQKARSELAQVASKNLRTLMAYEEMLSFEKQRCEVFQAGGSSGKIAYIKLYTPFADLSQTESVIEEAAGGLCYLDVERDPKDAPTMLSNPPVFRSFESLTKLFSLPRYNQIDPTMLMAPGFVVFFGLMLTDAVYGVMLIFAAAMLKKKYGGYSKGVSDMMTVMMLCGLSSIFFGLLTGSILGDLVGKYVLGGEGSQTIAIWLDPMYGSNAITFLLFVCALGLIHLYVGYFFGAVDELRRGNKKKALTHYMSWYILLAGGVLLYLNQTAAGAASALVGLGLLFSAHGLMLFIDLIGFVGSTLSYARLLAMGLTTAGIAMTFNFLSQMVLEIPYVGIVFAAAVFIAGHVINILINTLGAFVHSLRLNYVEFFGTFYEGGGVEYTPFVEERKITEVGK